MPFDELEQIARAGPPTMTNGSTRRLSLTQATKDSLWAESGGHCQNPQCRADLLGFIDQKNIAELAHIIPASKKGPRAADSPELTKQERSLPENILVLCPICHTVIDKSPEGFPSPTLRGWKEKSQRARAMAHGTPVYDTRPDARKAVERLLDSNRTVFDLYGPRDDIFDESRAERWRGHVRDSIIPNNDELLRIIEVNRHLLSDTEKATVQVFELHAKQLKERHIAGDWTPGSITFPGAMTRIFGDIK
ncbi:HNH endonuclease [Actinoplanes sp. NPDC049265]|uniref:HNH endonuclease n=1 Tax=Actinoplanes sp. NPDC049265 TaxID=3363902 RepID=UPI0037169A3D